MKVLLVTPGIYVYGGAEIVLVRLADHLAGRGIRNALLTTAMLPEMEADLPRTEIILAPRAPFPVVPKRFRAVGLEEARSLRRVLRKIASDFDVVNVHNFPAELASPVSGPPVVWLCNEPPKICLRYEFEKRRLHRFLLDLYLRYERRVVRRWVKTPVVADEFNAARFRDLYGVSPAVVPYGIDSGFFRSGSPEAVLGRFKLDGRFVVLQVGMLTPFKNQMESLRAMLRLRREVPEACLVLAGLGEEPYHDRIRSFIQDNDLASAVVLTGHLDRTAVRDLYHAADVLVHPILPQGGWLSPFEALTAGLPVVVSPGMTASGLIRDHNLGIVTDDVASGVLEVYRSPEVHRQRAAVAGKWVERNLSWDKFCSGMTGIFEQAAGAP